MADDKTLREPSEEQDNSAPIGMSDDGELVLSSSDYDDEFNEPIDEPDKTLDRLFRRPRIIIHRR